jgi:hypothetical protein
MGQIELQVGYACHVNPFNPEEKTVGIPNEQVLQMLSRGELLGGTGGGLVL